MRSNMSENVEETVVDGEYGTEVTEKAEEGDSSKNPTARGSRDRSQGDVPAEHIRTLNREDRNDGRRVYRHRRRRRTKLDMDQSQTLHIMQAIENRKLVLDAYAGKVSSRDTALDARAAALHDEEVRLQEYESRILLHEQRVAGVERTLRLEMARFLENIAHRQQKLFEMEQEKNRILREARANAEIAVRQLKISDEKMKFVEEETIELARVSSELRTARKALSNARVAHADIEKRVQLKKAAMQKLASDRNSLARLEQRLRDVENTVSSRHRLLLAKEHEVESRETAISKQLAEVDEIRGAVESLQDFVCNARLCSLQSSSMSCHDSIGKGSAQNPQRIAAIASEAARDLSNQLKYLESLKLQLNSRSESLKRIEEDTRRREHDLRLRENAVEEAQRKAERLSREAETKLADAISKAAATANMRTLLDERESSLQSQELSLHEKEASLFRQQKELRTNRESLAIQERSVNRANELVVSREAAVSAKSDAVSLSEIEVCTRERDVQAREATCSSREAELRSWGMALAQRENELRKSRETGLHQYSVTNDVVDPSGNQHSPSMPSFTRNGGRGRETVGRQETSQTTLNALDPSAADSDAMRHVADNRDGQQIQRSESMHEGPGSTGETVRKKLDFTQSRGSDSFMASTGEKPSATTEPTQGAMSAAERGNGLPSASNSRDTQAQAITSMRARNTGAGDDASEVAAEELLDELVSARSVWRERIERLENVLLAITASAVEHGVVSLVSTVENELRALKTAVKDFVPPRHRSAKQAFEAERQAHLSWGTTLRSQLDTIREVQAGLLLSVNDNATETDRNTSVGAERNSALEGALHRSVHLPVNHDSSKLNRLSDHSLDTESTNAMTRAMPEYSSQGMASHFDRRASLRSDSSLPFGARTEFDDRRSVEHGWSEHHVGVGDSSPLLSRDSLSNASLTQSHSSELHVVGGEGRSARALRFSDLGRAAEPASRNETSDSVMQELSLIREEIDVIDSVLTS